MLLDYELVVSCALAALVILRIIHLHQESRRLRERLRLIRSGINKPHDPAGTDQATANDSVDRSEKRSWSLFDRLIILALILALVWFAGRIWMQT